MEVNISIYLLERTKRDNTNTSLRTRAEESREKEETMALKTEEEEEAEEPPEKKENKNLNKPNKPQSKTPPLPDHFMADVYYVDLLVFHSKSY